MSLPVGDAPRPDSASIPAGAIVEAAVLSFKSLTARCRLLASGHEVTLRSRRLWTPGEIVTVKTRRAWQAGEPHLSAQIVGARIDAPSLKLKPLRLLPLWIWNPAEEYWGEPGDELPAYAKAMKAWGPRQAYDMELVIPGWDFEDPDEDPIGIAADLLHHRPLTAFTLLMRLCEADLRCLDAHAHLGILAFERRPQVAIAHYEVGVRIGELSAPPDFDAVLSWGCISNRPFLRCLHGYGLCLWRLGRLEEAGQVFQRMLWLNPRDNQGIRLLIDDVAARVPWEQRRDR